ncbi:hypothetical protein ACTZWW_14190 [Salinarimonas sp. NSM]|uniref:hypothetical protein n=1 Tax=Salinarimonas sp. NSM TaxID=3458003 RepID=UPI0040350B6B
MSISELIAIAGFAGAAIVMLLVTQTKQRVSWPGWLVPAAVALLLAAWTGWAAATEGLVAVRDAVVASPWSVQIWVDRMASTAAAFFLLQNRARAIGMKSEVWVLAVVFTGGIGLLAMLARVVHLERRKAE